MGSICSISSSSSSSRCEIRLLQAGDLVLERLEDAGVGAAAAVELGVLVGDALLDDGDLVLDAALVLDEGVLLGLGRVDRRPQPRPAPPRPPTSAARSGSCAARWSSFWIRESMVCTSRSWSHGFMSVAVRLGEVAAWSAVT